MRRSVCKLSVSKTKRPGSKIVTPRTSLYAEEPPPPTNPHRKRSKNRTSRRLWNSYIQLYRKYVNLSRAPFFLSLTPTGIPRDARATLGSLRAFREIHDVTSDVHRDAEKGNNRKIIIRLIFHHLTLNF